MSRDDELVQLAIEIGSLRERLRVREYRLDELRNGKSGVATVTVTPAGGGSTVIELPQSHSRQIIDYFAQHPGKAKIPKLIKVLAIPKDRIKTFRSTMTRLAKEQKIARAGRGEYQAVSS